MTEKRLSPTKSRMYLSKEIPNGCGRVLPRANKVLYDLFFGT